MNEIKPGTIEYKILLYFLQPSESIKPSLIAKKNNIPHQTINSALKRMTEMDLIHWQRYKNIELTYNGYETLKHLELHLKLISLFLQETLALTKKNATDEAMELAPYFSCAIVQQICAKYNKTMQCFDSECHSHEKIGK